MKEIWFHHWIRDRYLCVRVCESERNIWWKHPCYFPSKEMRNFLLRKNCLFQIRWCSKKFSSKWLNKRNSSFSMTIYLSTSPYIFHSSAYNNLGHSIPNPWSIHQQKSWVISLHLSSKDNWILKNDSCAFFIFLPSFHSYLLSVLMRLNKISIFWLNMVNIWTLKEEPIKSPFLWTIFLSFPLYYARSLGCCQWAYLITILKIFFV